MSENRRTEFLFRPIDEDDVAAQEDLRSLEAWFSARDEPDAEVALRIRPPRVGELGGQPEELVAIAGAVAVARAFTAWLRERVRSGKVNMTLEDGFTKRKLELRAGSSEDIDKLMPMITGFYNDLEE